MIAHVGDEILLQPPGTGRPTRYGEVLEAGDPDGNPPFLVRWDDGKETLLFPGPDAAIRHLRHCGPTDDFPGAG